jgi:nicotinamide riboside transporter PnuC
MNNKVSERIHIAMNFKSIYNWKGKSSEKREKILKRLASLDFGIVILCLSILIVLSAISIFKTESFSGKWTNAGLLVLMTMALSFRAPFSYIELILQKHINKIRNIETEFDEKINIELDNIIKGFNKRMKYVYLTGIPAILIFIPALLQVFDANPYWDKFPPLVLIISLFIFVRINYDILILKKNLKKIE